MAAKTYPKALRLVLAHEGVFTNHPLDPGGATNFGIIQKVYDAYRRFKGLPTQSVKLISNFEVQEIYWQQYWKPINGDKLPAGIDYAVFDFAVNSGVSRAAMFIQRVARVNDVDGIIGFGSLAAINAAAAANELKVINDLCNARQSFLESLKTFATFGKGWTRRVKEVNSIASKIATSDLTYTMPSAIPNSAKGF